MVKISWHLRHGDWLCSHFCEVFEIKGPLFFGAAYKFNDAMKLLENPGLVLVIRMRNVPVIDATGIRVLREVHSAIEKKGTKLILAEVNSNQVINELKKVRLVFQIGKGNILETFERALTRANEFYCKKRIYHILKCPL